MTSVKSLLSPSMAEEFSTEYVKKIFNEVNDDDFVLCYHNCGNTASDMANSLSEMCADIFHFGNAVDIKRLLEEMPKDRVIMGNIDPVLFRTATSVDIEKEVERVYQECSCYDNFMLSTGCDVPPEAKWENLDTAEHCWGKELCRGAYHRTPEESLERILEKLTHSLPDCKETDVMKLIKA